MARVVVTKKYSEVEEASAVCPVSAFKTGPNKELVIDPNACIDCGVCQSSAPDGAILADSDASEADVKFNADNATKWG